MWIFRNCLFLLLLCGGICCQLDLPNPTLQVIAPKQIDLLIFKKEQELELWIRDSLTTQKKDSFTLQKKVIYPIGIFNIFFANDSLLINDKRNLALRNSIASNTLYTVKNCPEILSLLSVEDAELLRQMLSVPLPKKLLVFPYRLNNNQQFNGQLNTAVWTTELYSTMGLWMKEYD